MTSRYYHGTITGIAPITWVIEQTSMAGAATVTLIADVCKAHKLTMGMLEQAGIPREEFAAWARAVCELSRNRLIPTIDSPINSALFKFLQIVCKEAVGTRAYRDYMGGDGRSSMGTISVATDSNVNEEYDIRSATDCDSSGLSAQDRKWSGG